MENYTQQTINPWFPDQVEPVYDPTDFVSVYQFKEYWKREKDRCMNGFTIADGQVKIPGRLYGFTVYGKIAAYIEKQKGSKTVKVREIITPLLRDIDWDISNDLEVCEEEGKFYDLFGSRDFGKSIWAAWCAAHQYTFYDNSESVISAGADNYIKLATDKIEDFLTNIHPVWKKQRLANDWKREVRAGWKDKSSNQIHPKSSNSRILMRNYENGVKSMAANGTRPGFHLIDEKGTIQHLIACVKDSDGCWWSGGGNKPSCLVFLAGTGGNMEVGAEAGEIAFNPDAFNMLAFDNPETSGKMGRFISALRAKLKYKEPWTLYKYLTEKCGMDLKPHPDLERITILVSNEEKALKEWWETEYAKALKSGNQKAITKFLAYWPVKPSDCFLVISANNFPVEACKKQKTRIIAEGYQPDYVEMYHDGEKVTWKKSKKLPITQYPVTDDNTDTPVVIYEHPVENPQWGLYLGGVDPYRHDEGDSLGAVYIYKRMHDISGERFQDMIVASYVGRPKTQEDWNEQARLLIRYYNAFTLVENDEYSFIRYMQNKGDDYLLCDQPDWLKDIVPSSNVQRGKGIHSSVKVRSFLNGRLKHYLEDIIHQERDEQGSVISEVMGVSRVLDTMLLEELIKYNASGNFDRVVACLTSGTPVLTSIGYLPIEQILPGDKVLTHTGNFKEVLATSKNLIKEDELISIKPLGFESPIACTKEHPFYTYKVTKGKGRNYFKNFKIRNPEWKNAEEISLSDFLLIPRRKNLSTAIIPDRLLYILGWYLSDGHRSRKRVRLTFQGDQLELAKQIKQYLLEMEIFNPTSVLIYNYKANKKVPIRTNRKEPRIYKVKGKNAYNLEFHSILLNSLIDRHIEILPGGEKIIKPSLFNSNNLLPLVLGFLEGDGHQKSTLTKGSVNPRQTIEVSGAYHILIRQIRQILFDNNIWCTSNWAKQKKGTRTQLRLDIQDQDGINKIINSIDNNIRKFYEVDGRKQRKNHIVINDGILVPIRKIEKSLVKNTFVFNLEVEHDNSFTASNIATHNCSLVIALADKMEPLGKIVKTELDPRYKSLYNRNKTKVNSSLFKGHSLLFNNQPKRRLFSR